MKNIKTLALVGLICLQAVSVSVVRAGGYLEISEAAFNGNAAQVQQLLDALPNQDITLYVNGQSDRNGKKLLHVAAEQGNPEVVKLLLYRYAANANVRDFENNTPLHLAAGKQNLAVVNELIKGGAKVNEVNRLHKNPLHVAAASGSPEIVLALLKAGTNKDLMDLNGLAPINYAVKRGNPKVLKALSETVVAQPRPGSLEESTGG